MNKKIKILLREGLNQKLHYIGQCDRLRKACEDNENYWQKMMLLAKPISFKTFINSTDMRPLIDDDETPVLYINNSIKSDKETGVYKSIWGNKPCMFLQTAGFEFIFV